MRKDHIWEETEDHWGGQALLSLNITVFIMYLIYDERVSERDRGEVGEEDETMGVGEKNKKK